MKLSNIARITKKHAHLRVFRTPQAQWASIGAAAYPLYGMPEIRDKAELLAVLDVPEDKREQYEVIFEAPDDLARFEDGQQNDTPLADKGTTFAQRGSYLRPLFAADGRVYWINECYVAPVENEENLTYWLRELEEGIYAVAVAAGVEIVALIGVRIASSETEEALRDIFRGCALSEQAGYRIPKKMIEEYGGYQIPVTGFINGEIRKWEESGERREDDDFAEVVHAEWIRTETEDEWGAIFAKWTCSNPKCCSSTGSNPEEYNYCPYCGAKMDRGKHEKV